MSSLVRAIIDMNKHHLILGHVKGRLLKESARTSRASLTYPFRTFTVYFLENGIGYPVRSKTVTRSDQRLGNVFAEVVESKEVGRVNRKPYALVVRDIASTSSGSSDWPTFPPNSSDKLATVCEHPMGPRRQ